jgi:hypothetical protein
VSPKAVGLKWVLGSTHKGASGACSCPNAPKEDTLMGLDRMSCPSCSPPSNRAKGSI